MVHNIMLGVKENEKIRPVLNGTTFYQERRFQKSFLFLPVTSEEICEPSSDARHQKTDSQ